MANRIIRDWTTSDKMDMLSPGAEVLFTRLIMKADDYGSFHANPKLINAALFPLKDYSMKQISIWLTETVSAGLVGLYEVDGKPYLRIVNFGQRLQNMRNAFPAPSGDFLQFTVNHGESPPETKRNEVEIETKQNQKQNPAVAVPFVGEVLNVWNEWVSFRKEKKAPLTPTSIKKQIQFLGGRGDPEIIAILNQSMTNGYTGLFELKNDNYVNGSTKKSTQQASAPSYERTEGFGKL